MRGISIVTFVLLMTVSYGFYQLQFEVEARQNRAAILEKQIEQDRQNIKVLEAEWALLSSPTRLQQLSNKFLELAPIDPSQIRMIDELSVREDGLQGAAFIDPEAPLASPDDSAPVSVAVLPKAPRPALPTIPVVNMEGTP